MYFWSPNRSLECDVKHWIKLEDLFAAPCYTSLSFQIAILAPNLKTKFLPFFFWLILLALNFLNCASSFCFVHYTFFFKVLLSFFSPNNSSWLFFYYILYLLSNIVQFSPKNCGFCCIPFYTTLHHVFIPRVSHCNRFQSSAQKLIPFCPLSSPPLRFQCLPKATNPIQSLPQLNTGQLWQKIALFLLH